MYELPNLLYLLILKNH